MGWTTIRRMVVALVLTAVTGVALYFALFSIGPSLSGTGSAIAAPTSNLTLTSREILWQLSWQAIASG